MKKILIILAVIISLKTIDAQHLTHDVGLSIGTVTMQTDYGQRYDFLSNHGNNKYNVSLAHYLTFYNKFLTWNDRDDILNYTAIKTVINFVPKTELVHFGEWANRTSAEAARLRAMKGYVNMISVGTGIEYYWHSLHEFTHPYSDYFWNPYVNFGVRYSFYENEIVSDSGDWRQDISVLPRKYRIPGNLEVGKGGAWSLSFGLGSRFNITERLDISLQASSQYFFSDAVDGLVAKVPENQNNDWMFNLQLGIVYNLNYFRPLFKE